jgi:hypothetical protein
VISGTGCSDDDTSGETDDVSRERSGKRNARGLCLKKVGKKDRRRRIRFSQDKDSQNNWAGAVCYHSRVTETCTAPASQGPCPLIN